MNFKKIRLLESKNKEYFLDCVNELYSSMERDTSLIVEREVIKAGTLKSYLIRILIKFPFLFNLKTSIKNNGRINFVSMISGDYRLLVPYAFFTKFNFVYMYDVWPRFHRWIFPLLDFFNVRYVFFSSKQVWLDFLRKYPDKEVQSMWLPEALDADEYNFNTFKEKQIDVLEFGRIYEIYHNLIKDVLFEKGKNHIYKKSGMSVLYPDKVSFSKALANSKIVICIPSNITHPERAEYISTMTLRYLQSMASKCLIVGIMPSDMRELFNYDPIVEIDIENAGVQILEILENYDNYIPLIEKNYNEVQLKHQWKNRVDIIKQKIAGSI